MRVVPKVGRGSGHRGGRGDGSKTMYKTGRGPAAEKCGKSRKMQNLEVTIVF